MTSLLLLDTLFLIQARCHWPSWPPGHTLAHVQLLLTSTPRSFSLATFQPLLPYPVALYGVVVAQVQDLAPHRFETHPGGLVSSLQHVQIPLQGPPALQQFNTPAQLNVACEHLEDTLDPLTQIINKDIKQDWS
ncbi:hypothetical protein HGM15179_010319 [Zosterops borbonicus]|uniref:Leptin n=1 Tax=Zosterops borbonicus TaxID=364589 RepID=A0A8K1GFL7_9PASS|nr:hypothetical protein HGM15179_010319 [Zosterops borbonicus]